MKAGWSRVALLAALLSVGASGSARAVFSDPPPVPSASDSDWAAGEALVRRDRFEEALPKLSAALGRAPNNADLNNMMGFTLRKLKRTDEAERHYQRALALDPDHRGAREYYGELLLIKGDGAKAREQLRVLERLCPSGCEELGDLQAAFRTHGVASR